MRGRSVVAFLVLVVAWSASGQHPNVAKGFQADKIYQSGGVDHVSLYNGNVTLTIPVGQEYGGNGTLRYRLTLVYNSKAWDQKIETYQCRVGSTDARCNQPYIHAVPSRRSNAGMGWLLSLGRLLAPDDPVLDGGTWGNGTLDWVYESADGADHRFVGPDLTTSRVGYTKDGSFLRLQHLDGGLHEVHFPDGMVHEFEDYGQRSPRLREIRDPFGNRLEVTYGSNGDWTLAEYDALDAKLRTHYVRFGDTTAVAPKPAYAPPNYDFAVREIDLAAFGGKRAVYSLTHANEQIAYGCGGDTRTNTTFDPVVPRLTKVTLPDTTSWEFAYYSIGCSSVQKMTLPTKGTTEWTYQPWEMPVAKCRQALVPNAPFDGDPPFQITEGIATKVVSTASAAATWRYTQQEELRSGNFQVCKTADEKPISGSKSQQSKVTVTAPDGTYTQHFFSVFPSGRADGVSEFDASEYGLPFTRAENAAGGVCKLTDGTALCLSTRAYDSAGTLLRGTFVRYEGERRALEHGDEQYRREAEQRTVFHDDGKKWVHTARSDYDGRGHYRSVHTSGSWSDVVRLDRTNYNPGTPTVKIDPVTWANVPANVRPASDKKWLFGVFDRTRVSYADASGQPRTGTILESEYLFRRDDGADDVTGELVRTRVLKNRDGSRSASDLVTEYSRDSSGNITSEEFYGGDRQAVGTGALSSLTLPSSPEYRIDHTYQHGTRNHSAYVANSKDVLRLFSAVIDQSTGLVDSEKDSADVGTDYHYDTSGRVVRITPAGRASADYEYLPAAGTEKAKVKETIKSTASGALTTRAFDYDDLGRVVHQSVSMPGGTDSRRETTYDSMGRVVTTSELGSASGQLPVTTFTYDALGRQKTITGPDGATVRFAYSGTRETTRTSSIARPGNAAAEVDVTHAFDPFGRLVEVRERSGPTSASSSVGAVTTTNYTYDAADRLTTVAMTGTEAVQQRLFDFDGRGFLIWESHPEAGMSSHTYDARGHVLSTTRGAARSQFDLEFTYDAAERLLLLKGRNPGHVPGDAAQPEFRPIKEFAFATSNGTGDSRNGKLLTATRYNYAPPSAARLGRANLRSIFKVSETYGYKDTAGRRTHRTTSLTKADSLGSDWTPVREFSTSFTYDDLDLVAATSYPMCLRCGIPTDWNKALTATYDHGRVSTVAGFVDVPITYWPNGTRHEMVHANAVTDTQTIDTATMLARPLSMKSGLYDSCTAPAITQQAAGGRITAGTPAITLSVAASGTAPLAYQWFANGVEIPGATGPTYTAAPAATTTYYVRVTNRCHVAISADATVSLGSDCTEPTVTAREAVALGNKSWRLDAIAGGAGPLTIKWYRSADHVQVGEGHSIVVGPITRTTAYVVRVTHPCSTAVAEAFVTVDVELPAPTNVKAAVSAAGNSLRVTWSAAPGAARYLVERRSGTEWAGIGDTALNELTDGDVATGRTYAYRVRAVDANGASGSAHSSSDVATIMSFTLLAADQMVSAAAVQEMLGGVNAVRAAVGWPAVTWRNIIGSTEPLPDPGASIRAAHITSCRARMNEALQALGVPAGGYTDAELVGVKVKALHVQQVQGRTQ